ncbi:MAG: hypothetical protein GWO22_32275, partial [Actinobacteria bacterium]|nr:hypothetical protein [Actinomycetota bacterium]NIT94626.1 hypothetical protein [Actinomycetota bacterium]NIX49611.1 hypothetical protein [Actinomycetota bacterium]
FSVDFSPKFAHRDGTVEVALQLPDHHDPKKVLLSTVTLEGVPALDEPVYYHDMNRDGHMEAILQFDLRSFLAALPDVDVIPVTLTGEVEDTVWFTRVEFLRGVARVDP